MSVAARTLSDQLAAKSAVVNRWKTGVKNVSVKPCEGVFYHFGDDISSWIDLISGS
jgi:hypothetical protein